MKQDGKKSPGTRLASAIALAALGVALGAVCIHIGDTDDAPGAALPGIVVMIGLVMLGVRVARRRT